MCRAGRSEKRKRRKDRFETTLFKSLYFSKGHAKPFKPRLSLEWSLKLVYRVFRDYRLVFARSSSLWKRREIFVDFRVERSWENGVSLQINQWISFDSVFYEETYNIAN